MAAATHDGAPVPGQGRRSSFPAPITILLLVLVAVWVAAFFIPSGQYQLDAEGSPIAGSFQRIEPPLDFQGRVRDLLLAPRQELAAARQLARTHRRLEVMRRQLR